MGKDAGSLNHLLYMDNLKLCGKNECEIDSPVNTVCMVNSDISMEFGLKKCGVLIFWRGNIEKCKGIDLPEGHRMKSVEEEGYKYLGVLEYYDLLH